jgi:hypothetical protein
MQAKVVDRSQMVGAQSNNSLGLLLQRMAKGMGTPKSDDPTMTAEEARALGFPAEKLTTKKK